MTHSQWIHSLPNFYLSQNLVEEDLGHNKSENRYHGLGHGIALDQLKVDVQCCTFQFLIYSSFVVSITVLCVGFALIVHVSLIQVTANKIHCHKIFYLFYILEKHLAIAFESVLRLFGNTNRMSKIVPLTSFIWTKFTKFNEPDLFFPLWHFLRSASLLIRLIF